MSRAAFAGLGLTALALAGILALELSAIEGGGDPATSTAAAAAVARWRPAPVVPTPPPPDRSGEWGATALARPLFAADRRPVAEPRSAAAAVAAGKDLPRLTGVLVGPAGRMALFAPATEGGRPVVVREGDALGVFEVKTILAGEVTVAGPEGERVLRPSHDPRAPAPAPRPIAASAPAAQPVAAQQPPAPPPAGVAGVPGRELLPMQPGLQFGGAGR